MSGADRPARRPNVLWVYCDELRADALGCYAGAGGFRPRTPAIDALAAGGVVFDACFTNSPVCVPSRTATLTGLLPEQTGVFANEAAVPGFPVPTGLTTFPEVLARAGYATASFGKEHVPAGLTPWQVDDHAGAGMRDPLDAVEPGSVVRTPGAGFVVAGVHDEDAAFTPEEVTRRALAWLSTVEGPFLLRTSFLQPHTPVVAPPRFRRAVDTGTLPDVRAPEAADCRFEQRFAEVNAGAAMSDDDLREVQASYHALVTWVDEQVGQLLAELDRRGLAEDTVVVLTSDHGVHLGEGGAFGKHTFAPRSHRVPLVVRWPGHLAPGRRADLVQALDLGRLVAGLTGVDLPAGYGGRDPFTAPAPEHVLATIGYGTPGSRAFPNLGIGTWDGDRGWPRRSCVRTARYRLDANVRIDGHPAAPEDEDVFLADVLADPDEVVNRADDPALADVRDRLLGVLRARAADAVEPPADEVDRLADEAVARICAVRAGSA